MENSPVTPKTMHSRAIVLTITLFVLIVVGMFIFTFLKQKEIAPVVVEPEVIEEPVTVAYPNITRIDGTHFFIDGLHTIVGELVMPTPCDLVEVKSIIAESYPEQVTLDFKVINNADFCAQQVTAQRFLVTAEVSEDASFSALFENRVVDLNLIDATPGELPEDFELFIKG